MFAKNVIAFWNKLTAPTVPTADFRDKSLSQLLSSTLLLVLVVLAGLFVVRAPFGLSSPLELTVRIGLAVLLLVGYFLSRRGHYRIAARMLVMGGIASLLVLALPGGGGSIEPLNYLAVVILFGCLFLPLLEVVGLIVVCLGLLLAYPLMVPVVTLSDVIGGPFSLQLTLSLMIIIIVYHRNLLDADRRARSDETLRRFMEQSTDGICLINEEGAIKAWNPVAEEITGLRRQDAMNQPIWTIQTGLIPMGAEQNLPEFRAQLQQDILRALRTGETAWAGQLMETQIQRPDGSERTIQSTVFPIETEIGRILGGILRDITERNEAEKKLRESEQAFRSLAQQAQMVNQIAVRIAAGLDLEQLVLNLYEQCQQIGDADTFYVALYDAETEVLTFPVFIKDGERRHPESQHIRVNPGYTGYVVEHRETLLINDMRDELPGASRIRQPGPLTLAYVGVPLILDTQVVGVLSMQSNAAHAYTGDQVSTLEMLANQIAIAIQNSQLYEKSQQEVAERKRAEEKRRSLIEQAADGIYLSDGTLRFTDVNSAGCELLGYAREELLQKTIRDVARFTPENPLRLEALHTGQVVRIERELVRKDGSVVPVEISAKLLPTGDYQSIIRDITERRQLEDEKQKNREILATQNERLLALYQVGRLLNSTLEFHNILDHLADDALKATHAACGQVLLVSEDGESYERHSLRGFTEEEAEQLGAAVLPLDRGIVGRACLTRQPVNVDDVTTEADYIGTVARTRSEMAIPIIRNDEVIGTIDLQSPEAGAFSQVDMQYLSALADRAAIAIWNARLYKELEEHSSILEQAVLERTAELQSQKEQAEAILESAADAMAITDPEGFFLAVNPAFVGQTGYTVGEAVNQHIRLLSSESPDSPPIRDVVKAARSARPWRMETQIVRKDGSQFDADVSIAPLGQGQKGQLGGFVIALHDVSLFKEVERMKDEFLSITAHELRTPLTSIRGFSEILLTRDLPGDRQKHYLETINTQSTQLGQIIDDLLDISRLESGRGLDLKPEPMDMATLIAGVVQPFVDTSPKHHFVLEGLTAAPLVVGDTFRIEQVLRNLLSNAVKYSPEGGPIVIRAETTDGQLAISVRDRGFGMTAEEQSHLFERFYRADAASRSIGGTGLGLTICKLIVEKHGGQMRVESEYGMGSAITFTVPLADAQTE